MSKILDLQVLIFFRTFFENKNSVPLTTPRIWWRIFMPKQIFLIMCSSSVIVGNIWENTLEGCQFTIKRKPLFLRGYSFNHYENYRMHTFLVTLSNCIKITQNTLPVNVTFLNEEVFVLMELRFILLLHIINRIVLIKDMRLYTGPRERKRKI